MPTTHPVPGPVLELPELPDRCALVLADGRRWSYQELARRVAERAAAWGPRRRLVLVEGANHESTLVSYLAALNHGHVALVVPDARAAQREAMVAAYDPDVVCTVEGIQVRRETSAHTLHPDLALLLSTSGSTGSPKTVRLSRTNVASNAAAIADYLALGPQDRAITTLPLHYCYGLSVLHSHLHAGASVVLTDRSVVDPGFWDLCERTRPTSFAGVPHTFELLERSGFGERDLPSLRYVTQAGGRLAPDRVKALASLGAERGWELYVMYGQTEATARMTWLPPHLAVDHPRSIGIPVPGGSVRLEPVPEATEPGTGELVYSGPNVMMGYAEGPEDLARGPELTELRTGDLAREVDGLLEVVGRRNRSAKVFGLRLDLDRLEDHLRSHAAPARCVATGQRVHAFVRDAALAEQVRRTTAGFCGIPGSAVRVHLLPELPLTGSGKVDLGALRARAEHSEQVAPAAPAPVGEDLTAAVLAAYALVLGRPDATVGDTFVGLGGDSLSYVELATRLERLLPGGPPAGWHLRRIAEVVPPPERAGRPPRPAVETTVGLRAVAIVLVVASHVDLISWEGGAHLLLALAGFNFARFQLSHPARGERVRHTLAGLGQLVLPSVVWVGVVALVTGAYAVPTVLFLNGLLGSDEWTDQWQFWFLEALVWATLAAIALLAVPRMHRAEVRRPFVFAGWVVAVSALARFSLVGLTAGTTERYSVTVVAFFFAIGWWAARATTARQRWVVAASALLLVVGFFGDPLREATILGGLGLLLWTTRLRCPRVLALPAGVLAGASLFVYLTHWQVYPPLEDAGHPVAALVASFAVGLAYAALMRPAQRLLGSALRSARPGGSPQPVSEKETASTPVAAGG